MFHKHPNQQKQSPEIYTQATQEQRSINTIPQDNLTSKQSTFPPKQTKVHYRTKTKPKWKHSRRQKNPKEQNTTQGETNKIMEPPPNSKQTWKR